MSKPLSYYQHNARATNDVELQTVEWTCPEPPADDSYVVREETLTEEQWQSLVSRLRKAGL